MAIVVANGWDVAAMAWLAKTELLPGFWKSRISTSCLIRAGYALLHLETYFTVGPKEARAWTIREGTLAPQAAGVIHGDFERGFIRAETIAYEDFVSLGGEQPAKEAGKMRAEGKAYTVKDGDVLHFLFNG